jgi:hypothetical protein
VFEGQRLNKRTVIVLGAGASMPYKFPSGEDLLHEARQLDLEQMQDWVGSSHDRQIVKALRHALRGTLERSIDAALETLSKEVIDAGKSYMARSILKREFEMRDRFEKDPDKWHEILWEAFDLKSIDAFKDTPLTLITYNYDRSVEFALSRSLQYKFRLDEDRCAEALQPIGPIHLHGQLGLLPSGIVQRELIVPFGGRDEEDGPTHDDCLVAARCIQVVHEPVPTASQFVQARRALQAAERVIFLGFGYAPNNMERLQLDRSVSPTAQIFLCVTGFSPQQIGTHIQPHFKTWGSRVLYGDGDMDIVKFFRMFPAALR